MINNAHVGRILPETNHDGWNHSESSINWSPSSTSVCIEEGYSFLTRTSRVGSDRISGECWRMFKEYLLTFEMNIGGKCKGNHSSTMEHLGCIYWMILFWLFWLFWLFMIFDSENGTTSWTMHSLWWCFSLTHLINSWISRWETNFLTIDRWCCSPWCGNISWELDVFPSMVPKNRVTDVIRFPDATPWRIWVASLDETKLPKETNTHGKQAHRGSNTANIAKIVDAKIIQRCWPLRPKAWSVWSIKIFQNVLNKYIKIWETKSSYRVSHFIMRGYRKSMMMNHRVWVW